jgi:hypothetical protein
MASIAIAGALLISCASATTIGHADDAGTGSHAGPLTVLVLGEDGHEAYLPRHDPAFRRVVSELQETMRRRGFRVVDEEALAAALVWSPVGGRDKVDVLETARLANASERAAGRVRAAILFRIESTARQLPYTTRLALHLSGEIYDVRSNRFLGAFDLPTETVTTAGRCLTHACASDAVGTRARDLASDLGAVLARKLAALTPAHASSDPRRVAAADGSGRALETVYTVTFRHLSTENAASIIDVMSDGFPGYRSHDRMRSGAALKRYAYVTTAGAAEIERWLTLLLLGMGLDPQHEISLGVRDADIRIERVIPATATAAD